jgi:hypothetical protein
MSGLIRLRLEPRTAIMAKAEVLWEDQPGAWRGVLARIEDTSPSGACIRLPVPVNIGAKLKIRWLKEEFLGIAKYCRRDGGDFVLGIQREASENAPQPTGLPAHATTNPSNLSSTTTQEALPRQKDTVQDLPKPSPVPGPSPIAPKILASPMVAETVPAVQVAAPQQQKTTQELPAIRPDQVPAPIAAKTVARPIAVEAAPPIQSAPPQQQNITQELPTIHPVPAPAPIVLQTVALPVQAVPKPPNAAEASNKSSPITDPGPRNPPKSDPNVQNEPLARPPSQGQERTIVLNKLLHIGSGRQKQAAVDGNSSNPKAQVSNADAKSNPEHQTTTYGRATGLPPNQGSLLSLQDIYVAVGIMSSRLGYNIDTVSSMLDSNHLQGMTDDVKRASILMAVEAAGIPIGELLQDGAKRLDALNSYEAAERKRFEEYEARKSQESAQIQLEIERMTAHCLDRIKHNLGEVTQAKDASLNWQTTKQKESQRISDAIALFSKPVATETPSDSKPELQPVGAASKR